MREIVNSEQDRNQNGLRHEIGRTAPGEAQRHARPGGKENVRKHNEAMKRPHVKPFDNMGKPMAGWILVSPEGSKTDKALSDWIKTGVEFAQSLPPK
jgi:hypothetical protein